MPQSAWPARIAWAMSGPVGHVGPTAEAGRARCSARCSRASSSSCAPAPLRPQREACAAFAPRPSTERRASADCRARRPAPARAARSRSAPRRAVAGSRRIASTLASPSASSSAWRWIAAAITSPARKRASPASLPSGSIARPAPLSRSAHCSSGSWLPPTIGSGSAGGQPVRARHAAGSQRSSSALREQPPPGDLGAGDRALDTSSRACAP